jgi:4-alpha-glucanotransferase
MVMSSPGNVAIFPMQDIIGLGSEARMNFPGTSQGNWGWRLDETSLTPRLAASLYQMTSEYERIPNVQRCPCPEVLNDAENAASQPETGSF